MENNNSLIPTNELESHNAQHHDSVASPTEDFQHYDSDPYCPRTKRGISLQTILIVVLLIMQLMSGLQMRQYKQYAELAQQEAYVLSVSISLLEDCLLSNYGLYPEDYIYFDENIYYLRDAWISEANYDTAHEYYEALSDLYEFFESDIEPIENIELIFV